jgi:predicted dehydrogenase
MYKCIITGLGGRGQWWLGNLLNRKDVQLVAAVEPYQPNADKAVARFGLDPKAIFPTLDEAIANAKADFVLDVTPPAVHHDIAYKAFAAGLHVIGEKPLSDNFAIAKQVADAGEKAGVKHMITQNYRFGPQPRTTRKLLAEGLIGQPGQCDLRFYTPWADSPGTHYVTQPYMLINDMMVHHFDMMRYVLDANPISVHAITWNQPWGWHAGDAAHAIVFEFPDKLMATHVCVGCAVGSQTGWNGDWRIEGPKGSITWDKDKMWRAHLHRVERKINEEIFPLSVPPSEQAMLDEFFAAIAENREPECSAHDNLESLRMVFGAIQSAKEGRKVLLSEVA